MNYVCNNYHTAVKTVLYNFSKSHDECSKWHLLITNKLMHSKKVEILDLAKAWVKCYNSSYHRHATIFLSQRYTM